MVNQTPSMRPADEATLPGVLKVALAKAGQALDVMLPVEVVSYDRDTNRASVRHMIQVQGSNGERVSRAGVTSVRVQQWGNETYSISLPILPGDKGWLIAADRDISLFLQGLTEGSPHTARTHSFADGWFVPDAMGNGPPPDGESDRVVIGSNDGSAYVSLDTSGVYVVVGGVTMEITASGVAITGGTVTHNGKNIGDTHIHSDVEPGSGTTGVPV